MSSTEGLLKQTYVRLGKKNLPWLELSLSYLAWVKKDVCMGTKYYLRFPICVLNSSTSVQCSGVFGGISKYCQRIDGVFPTLCADRLPWLVSLLLNMPDRVMSRCIFFIALQTGRRFWCTPNACCSSDGHSNVKRFHKRSCYGQFNLR